MSVRSTNSRMSEMESLKARLKATWESGDYGHFATYLEPGALEFLERIGIEPGERVLDVACGAGQISIPAARDGARVTGLDLADNLVEQARVRARREGVDAQFDQGDAEAMPYDDEAFDVVISLFGAMFAPQPDTVASELLRVCRPGGRIVMGNWTPEGFVGQMFRTIGGHVPPPSLMAPPVKWGDPDTVRERFGDRVAGLEMTRHLYSFDYPFPPAEVVEFFRVCYGPANRAFAAIDEAGQAALRHDLEQLWIRDNMATNGGTRCDAEYLQVTAIRS